MARLPTPVCWPKTSMTPTSGLTIPHALVRTKFDCLSPFCFSDPRGNSPFLRKGRTLRKQQPLHAKLGAPQHSSLWPDKYKPTSISQMCYPTCAYELLAWMTMFPKEQRAALLSGPPGVGKTTSVYLVAKELGKSVLEYNASDFRSKKSLHEHVAQVINNRVFASDGLVRQQQSNAVENNFVLLMDEVDGCDLGGVSEIIRMIQETKIPIICTCNNRRHQKLRPLTNHVKDIRFTRPPCNIVANFICNKILARENISLSKQLLQDIIQKGGSDIRSILNNLQLWCLKRSVLDQQTLAANAAASAKDTEIGLFQAPELFLRVHHAGVNGVRSTADVNGASSKAGDCRQRAAVHILQL